MLPKTLWVLRGVHGTGKTTLAEIMVRQLGGVIVDVNQLMVEPDTGFRFDRRNLRELYAACDRKIQEAMALGLPHVYVTNTCPALAQVERYEQMALRYGYSFSCLTMHTMHGNPHGVPVPALQRLSQSFEYPVTRIAA